MTEDDIASMTLWALGMVAVIVLAFAGLAWLVGAV